MTYVDREETPVPSWHGTDVFVGLTLTSQNVLLRSNVCRKVPIIFLISSSSLCAGSWVRQDVILSSELLGIFSELLTRAEKNKTHLPVLR